jgi:MSHA biogenesis protein MshO
MIKFPAARALSAGSKPVRSKTRVTIKTQAKSVRANRGFSLMELITVIILLGIITISVTNYLRFGADIYADVTGREQLLSETRFVIERMTREIREAVPNSVRVRQTGTVQCAEFLPIRASSSYVDIPVFPEAATATINLVQHNINAVDADKIVIYPLQPSDIYGGAPTTDTTGKIFSFATAPSNGNSTEVLTLDNAVRFDADSPTERYYLAKDAVSFCVDSVTDQITRYNGYWPGAIQAAPPAVAGVLMSDGISNATPFKYSGSTLTTNAIIQITLETLRDEETVTFYHEVHLINVP